jgi:predicted ATPase/class 3 adenylate cyclase
LISPGTTDAVAILFTDIEGSTRLWDETPDRMRAALAQHDVVLRDCILRHAGTVVKTTGDGVYAAFADPLDGFGAALAMQRALGDPASTEGLALRVRIGLHVGLVERRDSDLFGGAVNRAARIMAAAHGGQTLVSEAFADSIAGRMPQHASLRELGSVRLRGLARAERLWQLVHPELRNEFPPLRSLETAPSNLSQQLASFVGRERERTEVAALLRTSRLVTLTGTGGLGKTRLSLQIGADLLGEYSDGVWIVELAPLTDPRLVPQAIASVLGVREEPGRPVSDALLRFVSDRRLLLILDNCEHLVQACAELAETLLGSGPQLSILASSREHLRIAAERVYPLATLSIPDVDGAIIPDDLPKYEGIRLFVERAVAVQPAFRLSARNAQSVIEICRRLDGIPLAIELAAARLRTLTVESIAARLDDRFRLLTRGSRAAEPRQQTLRALIDWSHDLLALPERALFRRLAVFAGGWTLQGAEAVGAGAELDAADVLEVLTALVEKSLVGLDYETGRYRLLETVRQYARYRLDESGEAASVGARHLDFYRDLSERASAELAAGRQSREWMELFDAERENLLTAHGFCGTEGAGERDLELAYNTYPYWFRRGSLETGLRVLHEALERPAARRRTKVRCRALHAAGLLACFAGSYAAAEAYLQESQAVAAEIGLQAGAAGRLQLLAFAHLGMGNWSAARVQCEQALALAREQGDQLQEASAQSNLAQTYRLAGELDEARSRLQQSIALGRELGNRDLVAMNTLSLAMIALTRGTPSEAMAMTREAAAIADELKSHTVGQTVLDVVASLAAASEHWEPAARFIGAAEAHLTRTGLRRDPVDAAFLAPFVARSRDVLGETAFATLEAEGRKIGYEDAMRSARTWLEGWSAP